MVHLVKKTIKGKTYLYLEERAWIDKRSKRIWSLYLGPEDKLKEQGISRSPLHVEYQNMSFGISAALYQIAQKIDLVATIDRIAGKQREQNLSMGEYILIAVLNRCSNPCTKSQLAKWFENDVVSTLFDIDPAVLNAQTYWNHFQRLNEDRINLIEQELINRVISLYDLDLTTLLFDPTNFYTYLEEHDPDQLAQHGHSKENRTNLRIVNVSLLCDSVDGIPLFHRTYQGNNQDAKHFKQVLAQISARFAQAKTQPQQLVLVFDKGNLSPEAVKQLEPLNIPFIASLRNSTQKELLQVPLQNFTESVSPRTGKPMRYFEVEREIYGKNRRLLVSFNPKKQKKEIFTFEKTAKKKHDAITKFLTKLNVKKWRSPKAVEKKLKQLIGKYPFNTILRYQIHGEFEKLQVDFTIDEIAKQSYLETLGRSIIFTNLEDWGPTAILQAFRDKYQVEDLFHHLKNPRYLSIRPMYHWNDICIRAHVFCCILGLLLLSLLRKELKERAIMLSYTSLLAHLKDLSITKIYASSKEQPLYKMSKMPPTAKKLFTILKLKALVPK